MAMIKKLLFALGIIFLCSEIAYSQQSTLKGTVKDQTDAALAYATVLLMQDGNVVANTNTNDKGEYQIFGISAGKYDLQITGALGCSNTYKKTGISITTSAVVFENATITCGNELPPVIITWEKPVFDGTETKKAITISGDELRKVPGRSITAALANAGSVTMENGQMTSVRGNRQEGQQTIIDGVRVRGNGGVSMQSIEEAELIQGGIPAEYGDGTSFTVITTKGISKDFHGSAEVRGSVEGYGNFLGAISLSGPLLKGKTSNDPARMGFLLTGEVSYDVDNSPAQGGTWRATDETIDYLIKNPLQYDANEFGVWSQSASYLESDAFYKRRVRDNAGNWNYLLQGKLDFLTGETHNVKISIGGSYEFLKGKNWSRSTALFNAQNNSETQNSTMRLTARINHRVYTNSSDTAIFKNIMYDININYTKFNSLTQDARHQDNLFNYGHIGYFKTTKANYYELQDIEIDSIKYYDMYVLTNVYDSLVTFNATGSCNPDLVYYTQNFVDQFSPETINDYYGYTVPYDLTLYSQFGALRNGDQPDAVYSLFYMPGTVTSGYSKSELTSIGAKASLSMNLKDHEFKLGYEFEKLTSRGFSVNPTALWTLMRQKANFHISELDVDNPILHGDTVDYNPLINLDEQTTFDRNLRTALGLDPDGSDWIDIDNLSPETYDLSMFSAEELLVGLSSSLVSYYGYDYTGTHKYNKKTTIYDFFNSTDENGNKTYNIGAYEPIYMALYLQDKFSIQSLLFNIGLRIDRFDANQSVLSDPYLFRAAYTVGELVEKGYLKDQYFTSNAGDDWVVYVNQKDGTLDLDNTSIIGYRSGNTWYDSQGQEVDDPENMLGANGGPILEDALESGAISKVDASAFEDYKPQWSVMPRVSFSFPVSDNSVFTAHYNIITSRPTNLQLSPVDYLFIEKFGTSSSNIVNNPNLKPQKSIDYEISFTQKVSDKSAVGITAYYSEKRDQIQSYRYSGSYPSTYYSYANLDFGTVQGFSFSYDLRRIKNVSLRAGYTLQFAKGTGSSSSSNLAIIASGQPNLRTLNNLAFDQRHRISANIDYRFDGGANYNGPTGHIVKKGTNTVKDIRWFENTGITILFSAASGLPYSRSSTPYSTYVSGTSSQLSGSINGSHKPWTFQCDIRIDKTFMFNLNSKDKEGKQKNSKNASLLVYLDITNVFNFKNIISVYTYTGNADDDGYLSATEYQEQINSQIYTPSYINYYNMTVQNPYNYSTPARVSLGLQFGF
jgi:hypothetical protein